MGVLKRLGMLTLALFAAVLFYGLSVGPAAWAVKRKYVPKSVVTVYKPLIVLKGTPLEPLLIRYIQWWRNPPREMLIAG